MNNISDKLVMIIILITIFFVFGLIFSVKSPERKVINSPIIWKDEYSNIANFRSSRINIKGKNNNLNEYHSKLFTNKTSYT